MMQLVITSVDYNPPELTDQVPFELALIRKLPGSDRPDYWLGKLNHPLRWIDEGNEKLVESVIVSARWAGTEIGPDFINLPIGIAYVIDPTVVTDEKLDFEKCRYVAIGLASVTDSSERPAELSKPISGWIARSFGLGKGS